MALTGRSTRRARSLHVQEQKGRRALGTSEEEGGPAPCLRVAGSEAAYVDVSGLWGRSENRPTHQLSHGSGMQSACPGTVRTGGQGRPAGPDELMTAFLQVRTCYHSVLIIF